MTRRCSHCSNNGHNSRTCPTRVGGGGGVKLFGVRLTDGSIIKKSASMGNLSTALQHYHNSAASPTESPNFDSPESDHQVRGNPDGYLSDDAAHGSGSGNRRGDRKKGTPWTEEEHRQFLIGLQKLGKGDWRGIARNYVGSRTPTQVASHAQKYFIRQTNATRRKRRSSLFDMVPDDMSGNTPTVPEEEELSPSSQAIDSDSSRAIPSLNLSLNSEFEPMEASSQETVSGSNGITLGFFPTHFPAVPSPFWPTSHYEEGNRAEASYHQVLKPTPVLAKQAVNVDELVGMSQLSIAEIERNQREPSPLSLKLMGESTRQSAFHANPPVSRQSDIGNGECPVQSI